ncbi:hypothetical protein CALCODRAFT_489115 [Calocera cornea HHB12733]|uniref:Zn(2)-C6 fungal-type domain-containing protein n=1 Tax=Calocera cornea HHB12733 TaxID=1353952 RepID=A0A166JMP8_9BASI|nr:hypothetical protein CALCODRAFT_489115 [Calocera cornea HHB12733]
MGGKAAALLSKTEKPPAQVAAPKASKKTVKPEKQAAASGTRKTKDEKGKKRAEPAVMWEAFKNKLGKIWLVKDFGEKCKRCDANDKVCKTPALDKPCTACHMLAKPCSFTPATDGQRFRKHGVHTDPAKRLKNKLVEARMTRTCAPVRVKQEDIDAPREYKEVELPIHLAVQHMQSSFDFLYSGLMETGANLHELAAAISEGSRTVNLLLSSEMWRGKIDGETGHIVTMDPSVPEVATETNNNDDNNSDVPVVKKEKIKPSKPLVPAKHKASSDVEEPKGSSVRRVSRRMQNIHPEIELGGRNNDKVIIPDSEAEKDGEELESKEEAGNGEESNSGDLEDKFQPETSTAGLRRSGKSARSGRH